jgi:hypothetical protein
LFAVSPVLKIEMIVWRRLQAKVKMGLRIDRDEVRTVPIVSKMERLFWAGISDKSFAGLRMN